MEYLKPALLILVPILNSMGFWLKGKKVETYKGNTYPNARIETGKIPIVLIIISCIISIIYGFIVSPYTGWRMILDAVVMTGLLNGLMVAFISMGLYDSARAAKGS